MEITTQIASRLKTEMIARGLSIYRLAQQAGMGYESTRRVILGLASEIRLYERVARILGLRITLTECEDALAS